MEHSESIARIIGKTNPKTEYFADGHPGNRTELTISQKIEKQLEFLTNAMHLDDAGRKHWYYRLKREYRKEAEIKKRLQ